MKRFYKLVSTHHQPQGWEVHLDGKPVKTPMKTLLLVPNEALAEALVGEWSAQEETIEPDTMPMTQILSTQIDRVSAQRDVMSGQILKFLDTDLLCYRAGQEPPGQEQAQEKAWDPWLDWFEQCFDTRLETTTALAALNQPQAAHKAVMAYVDALDDARFTVLQLVVPLSGSLVLGIAFVEQAASPQQVFDAARVEESFKDEIYNAELYGRDPLQDQKDDAMRRDLEAAQRFLKLL